MTLRRRNDVDPVTIVINRWERDLILRYGYPFEDIERQLRESGEADLTRVIDVPFYWEQLIYNLRISVNEKPEIQRDDCLWESVEELIEKTRSISACSEYQSWIVQRIIDPHCHAIA